MNRRLALTIPPLLAALTAADPAVAATTLWWDTGYLLRFEIDVAAGPNAPDRGYNGYTARIPSLDTAALVAAGEMQADCDDLRIAFYDGLGWTELPRHVLNCNTATTDVRFTLAADIPASASDDNYYLYYSNAAAGAPAAVTTTNVYLWYDDASIDRSASYIRGRIDPWHGTNWDNSLAWNAGGYYTWDNGDNFTSGYRRDIDERDVYLEAEFFHTGCYQLNITIGLLARGIIQSGTLGSEQSNHYYASNRGEYPPPGCTAGGYGHDGDIVAGQRTVTAINGPNPPDVIPSVWRRQGLAVWLINPTNGAFWDEDNSLAWAALGYPGAANLHVSGTHANDDEGRGFGAVMTAQGTARLRNVLMRRYIAPEPVLTLTPESQPPTIVLQKNVVTVYDPINNTTFPKAIPGAWVEYTITTTNNGPGDVDNDTLVITDPIAADAALFVGDLGAAGSGPVEFTDGAGPASSGLTYTYGGLADLTDDVDFSVDGIDYSFVPTPDADGFDAAVRYIRINPGGVFLGGGGTPTTFDLRMRVRVQ